MHAIGQFIEYVEYFLMGLLTLSFAIQMFYYLLYYLRVVLYKRAPQLKKYPVSVIICARNEAENLEKNLPSILEQKHENFEVIVVNDCSTDHTDEVLGKFLKKYKKLRTTSISPDQKFTHGKKLAVTVGIKAAKNEWLVFTDADCRASSDQWLNRIQENFTDKKEIVLGYGGYDRQRGLLNAYIRYDTLIIAMQYFGYALGGLPYMGVGRNLAYRKSLFFNNKGFASHYGLASGDDDLFVNETATKRNVAVEYSHEAHTRSIPENKWTSWSTQKKRHFTTAGKYRSKHIFLLGFEPLSRFLFYFIFAFLMITGIYINFAAILVVVRLFFQLIIIKLVMRRLNERKLLLWVIIFDIMSLFINFNLYLATSFRSKKFRWK